MHFTCCLSDNNMYKPGFIIIQKSVSYCGVAKAVLYLNCNNDLSVSEAGCIFLRTVFLKREWLNLHVICNASLHIFTVYLRQVY